MIVNNILIDGYTCSGIVEVPEGVTVHTEAGVDDLGARFRGDLNLDLTTDANDATMALVAAASAGAGRGYGLAEFQVKAGDVNGDAGMNAMDATYMLQYAAAAGAGNAVTWEELIK